MTGEVMTPLLPCGSIDEIGEFYRMLGFEQTYRQVRPNPYLAMRREDINLHFFGMPGFEPAESYGSCLVAVPDIRGLYESFAAGMRTVHGTLLISGTPRMTRPRKRKNADNLTGFLVVDPGGNWIRFLPRTPETKKPAEPVPERGRLRRTLADAVVLADSHGADGQAAKVLDATLAREQDTATKIDLVDALAYRAELAVRMDDPEHARHLLDRLRTITLTRADRRVLADTLSDAEDLQRILNSPTVD
ncbi:VOC family protein [Nocardia brasiliensis]|uniref:VOC family protein n=1 Tax=Nocardia brasiliensis TaxID=37326 RepID=UPI00366BFA0B